MNPTKLPKTRAYTEMSHETIVAMCKRYGKPTSSVPKSVNHLPWNEKYPVYMEYITGHQPCPICNGPVKYEKRGPSWHASKLVCIDHPMHTTAISVAETGLAFRLKEELKKDPSNTLIAKAVEFQRSGTRILLMEGLPAQVENLAQTYLLAALGPVCEHNDYLVDCEICSANMESLWEERRAVEVGTAVMA